MNLNPLENTRQNQEKRSKNETETREFLKSREVKQLPVVDLKLGQPFLYVFEEAIRGDYGRFSSFEANIRPSIARVSNPIGIIKNEEEDEDDRIQNYTVKSKGRVDYYCINNTGEVVLVNTSNHLDTSVYKVHAAGLYHPSDDLFPPSDRGGEKISQEL